MQTLNQNEPGKKRKILSITSLILGVVAAVGSIIVFLVTAYTSFSLLSIMGEAAEFVIPIPMILFLVCEGIFFLCPPVGVALGAIALKKETNRGLAVSGLVLNSILLSFECCLAGAVIILST